MNQHTLQDLQQLQMLPLNIKIGMTERRIRDWVDEFGQDGVYVSFSGGKDSTVLVDIVRNRLGYTDIPLLFVNTGLEYPEIVKFVQTFDNVVMLRPKMNFKKVLEKYGYPFFGKETAEAVYHARLYLEKVAEKELNEGKNIPYSYAYRKVAGLGEYERQPDYIKIAESKDKWEMPYRVSLVMGGFETHWEKKKLGLIPKDGTPSRAVYSKTRYKFMLDAPFRISHVCCSIMKKAPLHTFSRQTGRVPITAQMAEESRLRTQNWLKSGCNGFQLKNPISNPMSFWTEQDVLKYIKEFDIPICSVYGDVVPDYGDEQCDGQLDFSDFGLIPDQRRLKTTGCQRTGCVFCGFGCHLEKGEGRFERLKRTHPKLYDYLMRPKEKGGLNYKEVIDWINEHGDMNIKY